MRGSSKVFLSATKPNLHTQHIPHSLGGFFLSRGGDMCVGIQREPGGEVAQHAGDGFDIHTVLQCDRSTVDGSVCSFAC